MSATAANTASPRTGADKPVWLTPNQHAPDSTATTASTGQPNGPVGPALLGRTSVGLLVVIGIILLCAWLLKRFGPNRSHNDQQLKLVASRSVGSRERVVIMEVEDRWLVLGVTANHISHLQTLDARPETPATGGHGERRGGRPTFRQALAENLQQLGQRGMRRSRP